ncbi:MAG: polysaccharide transporter PST [Geobacteraceae bacterium]|nr:MAG: polysaccharide transporter PST [Geobacteraceae bacterium]
MNSLRARAITSLSWSVFAKLVSQSVTFLATVLLARKLGASEFGLAALSLVYIGFIQAFIDAGFLQALIQRPALVQQELASCFWFLLAAGFGAFGASLLASDLLEKFFATPGIGLIIVAQSSIFLFLPFRTLAQSILSRDVRLNELSKLETVLSVVRLVFSLLLAWNGAGVWSLVLPLVIAEIAYSLLSYRRAAWRLTLEFNRPSLKPILGYGVDVSLSRIVWFGASRADQFIIGKMLGTEALGLYSLALQFANALPQFASGSISRVVFPVFARLQHDPARLKRVYLVIAKYSTILFLPAFAGIGLLAPDLFALTFKPSWQNAVIPLQVLCILAFLRLTEALSGFLINAIGRTRLNLISNVIALAATAAAVYLGARLGGLNVITILTTLSFVPVTLLTGWFAMREIGGSLDEYLSIFRIPVFATLVMGCGVAGVGSLLPGDVPMLRIAVMLFVGVVAYSAVLLVLSPGIIREIRNELPSYHPV